MFSEGSWYSTMNATFMIYFSPFIHIIGIIIFDQFYHENTVGVNYKVQVDNVISVVVHDNHWCHWILCKNANSFLYYFH